MRLKSYQSVTLFLTCVTQGWSRFLQGPHPTSCCQPGHAIPSRAPSLYSHGHLIQATMSSTLDRGSGHLTARSTIFCTHPTPGSKPRTGLCRTWDPPWASHLCPGMQGRLAPTSASCPLRSPALRLALHPTLRLALCPALHPTLWPALRPAPHPACRKRAVTLSTSRPLCLCFPHVAPSGQSSYPSFSSGQMPPQV